MARPSHFTLIPCKPHTSHLITGTVMVTCGTIAIVVGVPTIPFGGAGFGLIGTGAASVLGSSSWFIDYAQEKKAYNKFMETHTKEAWRTARDAQAELNLELDNVAKAIRKNVEDHNIELSSNVWRHNTSIINARRLERLIRKEIVEYCGESLEKASLLQDPSFKANFITNITQAICTSDACKKGSLRSGSNLKEAIGTSVSKQFESKILEKENPTHAGYKNTIEAGLGIPPNSKEQADFSSRTSTYEIPIVRSAM